jgi:aminoglycoside phosphotransferase (APT) family kinase protein
VAAPVTDPIFLLPGKPSAREVNELLSYARAQLQLGPSRPWRLLQSGVKLGKVFLEVEEITPEGPRRIFGKVSKTERARRGYENLRRLWNAGMCPPAKYRVCEPIGFFPGRGLLLQCRARGTQLLEAVKTQSADPRDIAKAAEWLVALQRLEVEGAPEPKPWNIDRLALELSDALPSFAERIRRCLDFITGRIETQVPRVASHGDYHLMNIYVDEECITAIDLDTFALREPMVDVSYFVAQSAIMGYHTFQSFAPTEPVRVQFIEAYQRLVSDHFDADRIRVHVALAFLRSLHYDFCILKLNPLDLVEPFLAAAEQCVEGEGIRLAA